MYIVDIFVPILSRNITFLPDRSYVFSCVTRYFENERTDFDANWRKNSTRQEDEAHSFGVWWSEVKVDHKWSYIILFWKLNK